MALHVGFTGTREGMNYAQKYRIYSYLVRNFIYPEWTEVVVHHGDCIGSDSDFHFMAKSLGMLVCVHPPEDNSLRAFCDGDMLSAPLDYRERDRIIVRESDLLLATPQERFRPPAPSGGTWYTINHAVSSGVKAVIFYSDGSVEVCNSEDNPGSEKG